MEQIERWAEYVKTHRDWKSKLKPFLDAQIIMSRRFYRSLGATPEGKLKVELLRKKR
jgi:hypothetical protein